MGLSGAIEIVQQGPGELKLVFPPGHAGDLLLFGLTALILVLALVIKDKKGPLMLILLAAAICFFNALSNWNYRGEAVLSVAHQTLTVTEHSFYSNHRNIYPLNAVESAVVQNGRYQSHRFAFLLGSGHLLPVGDYRSGSGCYEAAEAVNGLLKAGRDSGK